MAERTYGEREIAQIIERAVERQEADRAAAPPAGLTLAEIERLGQEVGVDPRHLRAAAAELDRGGGGRQSGQTATHAYVERWLPGTLHLEAWEDAVVELQGRFGTSAGASYGQPGGGTHQQIGNTHEWSHTSAMGVETRVVVSPRGDRVRLRLSQWLGYASPRVEAPLFGGVLAVLAFLFSLTTGSPAAIAAITTSAFVLLTAGIYVADRAWRQSKHRRLEALADDLSARLVAAPPTAEAAPAALPEAVARLDPSLLDEPEAEAPEAVRARRARA